MDKINIPKRGDKQIYNLRKKLKKEDYLYYVYVHYKNNKPIYVGKGTFFDNETTDLRQRCFRGNRGTSRTGKYKVTTFIDYVVIVDFYKTEKEAFKIEEEMTLKLKDNAQWSIYNDNVGEKRSKEFIERMSEQFSDGRFKGENNPMYGKRGEKSPLYNIPRSMETRKKISESNKGKVISEETKEKMHENHADYTREKHPRAKKVMCLTTQKIFNCIRDASEYYSVSASRITACCKKRAKSAGKYKGMKLV